MTNRRNKNEQPDILQSIVLGIGRAIWRLISFPFRSSGSKGLTTENRNYIATKRHEIENLLRSESDIELRHAVMEADKLVDYTLKSQGFSGETFADRIRKVEQKVSRNLYNDVWSGHKTRNQIAHETNIQISKNELRMAADKLLRYTKSI